MPQVSMPQVLEFERVDRESANRERIVAADQRLAIAVIVVGLVSVFGAAALEPAAPHHAQPVWELVADVGQTVFFGLAFLGAYTLLRGKALMGFGGLAAASYVWLALVVGCPTSGHHAFGGWWAGQMALALAFAAVSTAALAITRSARRPTAR